MTAAATTGPNRDPRPTSSTPATNRAPEAQASFSYLRVHFNLFSRRSLSVALETAFVSTFFFGDFLRWDFTGCKPILEQIQTRRCLWNFFVAGRDYVTRLQSCHV